MIAVDTSVWVSRLKAEQSPAVDRLNWALDTEIVVVGDVVLLEILQGARDERQANLLSSLMAGYVQVSMLDANLAIKAATSYRKLRSLGITIRKTIDLIIGTWCIENNCPLLHNDRDFLPMVQHLGLREF